MQSVSRGTGWTGFQIDGRVRFLPNRFSLPPRKTKRLGGSLTLLWGGRSGFVPRETGWGLVEVE